MDKQFFKFSLFSNFPELVHGISNRSYGQMKYCGKKDGEVRKNRQLFLDELGITLNNLVVPKQVHSSKIIICDEDKRGEGSLKSSLKLEGVDGLITTEPDMFLSVLTADCLPVLFYDPIKRISGIAHCGWRGIIDQIIPKMIDQFKNLGSDPENLIVGIGPGICQRHFVVKKDVLKFFMPLYSQATFVRNNDGYIDLKKTVLIDLKKAEIPKTNIEMAPYCTSCDNGIYPSFRKEGEGVMQIMSVIGMKK